MATGVDVHCYYQRGLRWDQVSGVHYVWVKVSEGMRANTYTTGGVTYRPDTHIAGAKSRGIPVGGYHYAQPGDPRAQADLLVNEVERLGATGVLPALDIEAPFTPNQAARDFGEAFCNRVRERGYRPVAYMSDSFAAVLKPSTWASKPVLWIARYGAQPKSTRYDVHQYRSDGALPGSAGAVDFNESYNDSHLAAAATNPPAALTGKIMMTEANMATLPAAPGGGYEVLATPPDANVKLIFASKSVITGGNVYNWSPTPGAGTGGNPGQWKTEVQEGEAIALPRGTSKAHIEYTCDSPVSVFIQAVA